MVLVFLAGVAWLAGIAFRQRLRADSLRADTRAGKFSPAARN